MSKLSFRARAVDAAKPLPVYRNTDVPDLADCACISRGVPPLPTGMETEEEREHHLQRAMSAQQVFRDKKDNMVIPVPEAESHTAYYDRLYRGHVKVPKQLIHIQPLSLDLDQPDYDLDSEDELLLNRLNRKTDIKPLRFEIMMDRLEKASTHQLVSVSEAKQLLDEDDVLLKTVYDYWLRKRRTCLSPSLTPGVKQERRDGSNNSDAYVAFRRRTEKMQTRKNRKSDEVSYEKMLRLRRDFSRSVSIVQMIRRREEAKRELLLLTLEEVQRRYQLEDFGGETFRDGYCSLFTLSNNTKVKKKQLLVRDELPFNLLRPKKKNVRGDRLCLLQRRPGRPPGPFIVNRADIKQYDFHSSGDEDSPPLLYPPFSPGEENNPDGVFVFRRKAGCQYLSPCAEPACGPDSPDHRHSLTELLPHWTGLSRRRRGRGGRIVLDRASSCLDPLLRQLDSLTRTSTCLLSDPPRTTAHSLTEVLNNIQNLRRFCFKARPLQDKREGSSRTTESSMEDSTQTCGLSSDHISGGLTEEEFNQHRKQLKLQLHNYTLTHTQSSRSGESSPKILDLVSAQFAASAVISALPPSCGHKLHNTHGVRHPSGPSGPPYSSTLSKAGLSARGTLSSSHPWSLPLQRSQVGAVGPAHPHTARSSAPTTSALKLAAARASLDPERLNENTPPTEVT